MKTCTKCGHAKFLSEFCTNRRNKKDGKNGRCKQCMNALASTYHATHARKILDLKAQKRAANPEPARRASREYHWSHRAAILTRQKRNAQEHPENRNRSIRKWRKTHPETAREAKNRFRRKYPEIVAAAARRRRAREKAAPINDFTAKQWQEMQVVYDHRCAYCHKRLKGKLTQDHIIPLSKEGSHTWDNIVPACRSCNGRKGTQEPIAPIQLVLVRSA